jgi:hypothetical protein
VSPIALLGVSLATLSVGAVLAAVTARINVTAIERGVTTGRAVAAIAVLGIGAGTVGTVIALARLMFG